MASGDPSPRVAFALGSSSGGVGRHVRSVAAGLVERGVQVVVLGPRSTGDHFGFRQVGARFVAVEIADRPHPVRDARSIARLRRLTRAADVVHAHGLRAGGLCATALVGRQRPALVVTLHNAAVSGGMVGTVYAALERVVARRAGVVLGVSPDLVARARQRGARAVGHALVPAPRAEPLRRDPDAVRAELSAGTRPVVLCVARLAEQKGLPVLVEAAKGWTRRTPPPLVLIVGDGPMAAELAATIETERVPVRLLGGRSDVPDLLAAADAVVVPSVWEGQPLVVQETLRAGRPLVATRVGGVPDMVGGAAILVPAGDPAALRSAVADVLDDTGLADRLVREALLRAERLPTDHDAVEQVVAAYRDVAGDSFARYAS